MSQNTIEISSPEHLPDSPVVSVYMATYNHAQFLAEAITGVVMQRTSVPFELIIGEDCSSDGSLDIARDFQQRYPHVIRIVTASENVGTAANASRCFARIRGAFLAYCEGDDHWTDPDKLDIQLGVFRDNPDCALVFHAARLVDAESGRTHGRTRAAFRSRFISTPDVILGDGGLMPTASIMVRSSLPRNRPHWWREAPIGDYPLALCAAAAGKIAYIDRCMSVYRTRVPGSWSSRHTALWSVRLNYAQAIKAMFDGFNEDTGNRYRRYTDRVISKYFSDVAVRISGAAADKRKLLAQVSGLLSPSDRLLAWVAVRIGLPTAWVKSLWRKAGTLLRVLYGELTQAAVVCPPSASKPLSRS